MFVFTEPKAARGSGYDYRNNTVVDWSAKGTYSTVNQKCFYLMDQDNSNYFLVFDGTACQAGHQGTCYKIQTPAFVFVFTLPRWLLDSCLSEYDATIRIMCFEFFL